MNSASHSRLQALDGLRGVSILLVLISHAWLGHIVPGGLGVTIFFFISGYIITRLMIAEWDKTEHISISKFYLRRFFRLMPALIVFVLISLGVMQLAGVQWQWIELMSVFFYFANYFGIFVGFSGDVLPPPLSITWSLAVEEHFYMLFPFVFSVCIAFPRRFLAGLLTFIIAILLWRLYLVYGVGLDHLLHYRIYKATDTRADSIMYGTCFALIQARYPVWAAYFAQRKAAIAGLLLMLASLLIRDENFRESWRYSIQGIALTLMFTYLITASNFVSHLLASQTMVYIGRISYSLYLYHWLVFGIITFWLPDWSLPARFCLMMLASFALADGSQRLVEAPFLRLGQRYLQAGTKR
ncbi:acyltransferase [Undibacterium sp. CY7W]|uniref:Acyltransferase n=1 Tax=Undibacterium rugosum TaxID=2762291 RepID=A0A923KVH4_9BURK|nr:acyltransferase [Undibacterium rugosum]MBC3935362.1 acyltransferase [Undibacterium rugosum]